VTATATASYGFHVGRWIGGPMVVMDQNRTIWHHFGRNSYTLSTTASTGGSVSGGGSYLYQTDVAVTASPDDLYSFRHWTGDASGSSASITVKMTSNKSVHAVFGDVCEEMPEVCTFSREEEEDGGQPEP